MYWPLLKPPGEQHYDNLRKTPNIDLHSEQQRVFAARVVDGIELVPEVRPVSQFYTCQYLANTDSVSKHPNMLKYLNT